MKKWLRAVEDRAHRKDDSEWLHPSAQVPFWAGHLETRFRG
jgi:hypothetical protein